MLDIYCLDFSYIQFILKIITQIPDCLFSSELKKGFWRQKHLSLSSSSGEVQGSWRSFSCVISRLPNLDGPRLPNREGLRLPKRDGLRLPHRKGARLDNSSIIWAQGCLSGTDRLPQRNGVARTKRSKPSSLVFSSSDLLPHLVQAQKLIWYVVIFAPFSTSFGLEKSFWIFETVFT